MPVDIVLTLMDEYLLVESAGEMATFDDGLAYIEAQVARARREEVRHLLVDDRNLTVSLDYADILALAEHWEEKDLPALGLRVAVLPPPSSPKAQQAYETVATNRSIVFKVFLDKQKAVDWLLKR